jgi:hypothetical protein
VTKNRKPLNRRHSEQLRLGSGIAEDVILGRGYRTIRTVEELKVFGYRPRVHMRPLVPGLLIPLHLPNPSAAAPSSSKGPPVLYRPDTPWWHPEEKSWVRYMPPIGSRNYIDVHPSMRSALTDTSKAAFIVEGHKKADSATSRGLLTLGISGVDCFLYPPKDSRGYRIRGAGSVPCDDWDDIPMQRDFVIVFDSDQATNPKVSGARLRLTRFLEGRGAQRVFWIDLPDGGAGEKAGLDDFFVAGGTVSDLRGLVRPAPGVGAKAMEGINRG